MYVFNRIFNNLINKICWLLLIVIVALLFFFFGLSHADASTNQQAIYLSDYTQPNWTVMKNCSSPTTCTGDVDSYNARFLNAADTSIFRPYVETGGAYTIGTSGFNIAFQPNQQILSGYMYSLTTVVCSNINDIKSSVHVGSTSNGALNGEMNYIFNNSSNFLSTVVQDVDIGWFEYCTVSYAVLSPKNTGDWVSLRLYRDSLSSSSYIGFAGYQLKNLGVYTSDLETSITTTIQNSTIETQQDIEELNEKVESMTEEQKQTNQKLDDLNNNITSDNTSGGESEGSSFFNDFDVNDNGGISGIITSPLRVINKMLEGNTCESLTFNLSFLGKNKQVSLPSGCIMWNKAPQSAVTIYQTLLCGLFSYILATNLFKDIEKLKNPKESEVDTLDL